jgi:ABC-type sugar transport system permease subunit
MKPKRRNVDMATRHKLEGLFFISPCILGTLIFFIYPLVMSIILSFGTVENIVGFKVALTGLQNYSWAFLSDATFVPTFLQVIQDTLTKAPLIIVFSILIAVMINRNIRARGFFRTVFFIPFLLGTGAVMDQILIMGVDMRVLSITDGTLIPYQVLNYFGGDFVTMITAFFSTLVQVLWSTGVQILLFLSGLQSISPALYESADIDGATEWEKFWKITIPMIAPIMLLTIVYTIVDSFTNIRNPMLTYIQTRAFTDIMFEEAAAMAWVYFGFIMIILLLTFVILRSYIESGNTESTRKVKNK